VAYNPNILRDVLLARSLSRAALSERLGMKPEDLERELGREPEPRQHILNDIAKELALPPFVFFMKKAPPLNDMIPDFRSATPAPTHKSKETTESIQFAAAVQTTAQQLEVSGTTSNLPGFDAITRDQIEEFALHVRTFFGVSLQDQVEAKDAKAFYNFCRKRIEDHGIFVLQDSFPETDGSGFCLAHPRFPVIVVNTKKQNRARRLFTLIHELAHVLIGQSGISDPFIQNNSIERRCNQFAASFLVPKSYIPAFLPKPPPTDPDIKDVASMARRLKISQQATILRLEELHLVRRGSHDRWLTAMHNIGNPDYFERRGGPGKGPPPQEKTKLAKYGFNLARVFDTPLRQGRISEINLYRATGLKPKYQREYFNFANSISDKEVRDLELDDE
jgi:Zn-dependent peptidase ImmA (M78 family)